MKLEQLTRLADRAAEAIKKFLPDEVRYTVILTAAEGGRIDVGVSSNATPGQCVAALEASADKIRVAFELVEVTPPEPEPEPERAS